MEKVSRLALAAALTAACAGETAVRSAPAIEPPVKPLVHEAPDAADPMTAFEVLAVGADRLAPAMREIVRGEKSGENSLSTEVLRAEKDACVRLAFAASTELRATLEDQSGAVLAETKTKAGALGERGPVCVRKGAVIRVRFDGEGAIRIRFIAWTSP